MQLGLLAPGVYREDRTVLAPAPLRTGIPGFAGFGPKTTIPLRIGDARDIAALLPAGDHSFLAAALRGFFDNGGRDCFVALAPGDAGDREAALLAALASLATVSEIDLLSCPDVMLLRQADGRIDADAVIRLQRAALGQCATMGGCFAILDGLPERSTEGLLAQRQAMVAGLAEPVNGALYAPWIKQGDGGLVPPSGHVAGVFAQTDAVAGSYRAPAGMALVGVVDLERGIDAATQGVLNAAGINGLRALPGRGIRVWGARTLSALPEWRHVNTRRMVLTLVRWIDANMGWAVFEPNAPPAWARIERAVAGQLAALWQAGALQGATAGQAFFVHCDGTTNPAASRDGGRMTVEIGIAPAVPAEFLIIRLTLQAEGGA